MSTRANRTESLIKTRKARLAEAPSHLAPHFHDTGVGHVTSSSEHETSFQKHRRLHFPRVHLGFIFHQIVSSPRPRDPSRSGVSVGNFPFKKLLQASSAKLSFFLQHSCNTTSVCFLQMWRCSAAFFFCCSQIHFSTFSFMSALTHCFWSKTCYR